MCVACYRRAFFPIFNLILFFLAVGGFAVAGGSRSKPALELRVLANLVLFRHFAGVEFELPVDMPMCAGATEAEAMYEWVRKDLAVDTGGRVGALPRICDVAQASMVDGGRAGKMTAIELRIAGLRCQEFEVKFLPMILGARFERLANPKEISRRYHNHLLLEQQSPRLLPSAGTDVIQHLRRMQLSSTSCREWPGGLIAMIQGTYASTN